MNGRLERAAPRAGTLDERFDLTRARWCGGRFRYVPMAARNSESRFGARTSAYDVVAGRDLSGRAIIVTGANTGIGEPTARALASAGARVIYACRQAATGEAAVARAKAAHPGCNAEFAELDLASFRSISVLWND